jgi:hypothetical protein
MQTTTAGQYRVLGDAPDRDGLLLLDRADHEPVLVTGEGYEDDLADAVDALRPGYLVDAELVCVTGLFEAALETMEEAHQEGLGVASRPTFSTDNEPNGAVYAFAEQPGERDVFEEIRTGALPVEPLVDRLDEEADDAHEVFVFDPLEHDFVIVYLVLHRDSVLADTVRDTYDCPRPPEVDPGKP